MPYRIADERYAAIIVARQGTLTQISTPGIETTTEDSTTSTTTTSIVETTTTTTTSSTTSTVDSTTTTSSPTTSTTTTAAADTTSTAQGTTNGETTTAATTASSGGLTSVTSATMVVTGTNGVVTTVFSTIPYATGTGSAGHSSSSSNTGAIVGGVVGGIGGLALLVVLFWFFRKRSRRQELDGDIFDPDRTAQRPGRLNGDVDLTDPQMEAHPYNYGPPVSTSGGSAPPVRSNATGPGVAGLGAAAAVAGGAGSQDASHPYYNHHGPAPGQIFNYPQQQYGESPYPAMPPGARPPSTGAWQQQPGPQSDLSRGPSSGSAAWVPSASSAYEPSSSGGHPVTDDGRASIGAAFLGIPAGGATSTSHSSSSRTKAQQAQAFRLANAGEEDGASGPVVQHQDGGRVREENASSSPPQEVPPAYDSIPQDEPGPSGPSASASAAAREEAARPEKAPRFEGES